MRPRRLIVLVLIAALEVILGASPSGALPQQGGAPYHGTEYQLGGVATPVDGPVPAIDKLADSITASTDRTLHEIAQERDKLRYGGLDGSLDSTPTVVTYPRPAGMSASDQYAATVTQAGKAHDPVVYTVDARRPGNREEDTSWTSFSFAGPVTVSVRKLEGDATACLVRPQSAAINTSFANNVCSFRLSRPANVSVEFAPNTTNPVLHPMLVFANPPETNVPSPDDPDVLYFGPGMHRVGTVQLRSNQTVYLAGGAWVEARFEGVGIRNVVIRGRGVIDGTFLDTGDQEQNRLQPGLIDIDCHESEDPPHAPCSPETNSRNILIDGLTLVNGPRFNIRALGEYITVRNTKIISWWINTDCIWAGNSSLVEGNFCKVNDDALKPMSGPAVIRDNVVWQLENGAPFMMSWNIVADQADFHIYDNDVIHVEHHEARTQGVFDSRHGASSHLHRYLFENIRIEDASWRLFYLMIEENRWYEPALGFGQISDLVFRNITAPGWFQLPSVIDGIDADHGFTDVDLVDVRLGDTCLTDAAAGNLQLDPASTNHIRIVKSRQCDSSA